MEKVAFLNGREIKDGFSRKKLSVYTTPEEYGAVGDGVTDDTPAFRDALATGKSVMLDAKTYLLKDTITVTSHLFGQGKEKTTILFKDLTANDVNPTDGQPTENYKNSAWCTLSGDGKICDITVRCETGTSCMVNVKNSNGAEVSCCFLESAPGLLCKGTISCNANNKNFLMKNTTSICRTQHGGGFWIREGNEGGISDGITIENCTIIQKGVDEPLAIWGWYGTVQNIVVRNTLIDVQEQEHLDGSKSKCSHVLTVGMDGDCKNVLFDNCTVNAKYNLYYTVKEEPGFDYNGSYGKDYVVGHNENIVFRNCTINSDSENLVADSASLTVGNLKFYNCIFNASQKQKLCSTNKAQGETVFYGCTFNCKEYCTAGNGHYEGCTINYNVDENDVEGNPKLLKAIATVSQYGHLVLKDSVINGVRVNDSSAVIFNILANGELTIDNLKVNGSIAAVNKFINAGAGAIVKVDRGFLRGDVFFNAETLGYVINTVTTHSYLTVGAKMMKANVTTNWAVDENNTPVVTTGG